jgi:hypothetical protein
MSEPSPVGDRSEWTVHRGGEPASQPTGWVGWIVFAAIMMMVIGLFNVIDGLVALFNNSWYVVTENALLTFNFTAWGWFMLIVGVVAVLTGFGVLAGQMWARVTGVVLVVLNALGQLAFMPAYPLWSILIIALDVVVIYALTAHGREMAA